MLGFCFRYAAALAVMVAGDAVWLGLIAKPRFKAALGDTLLDDPRWLAAAAFYVIYSAGISFLAVAPALRQGALSQAFVLGAALGLFAYMTYDLTNLATLRPWTPQLAAMDIAWGTLLTAAAAAASYAVAKAMHIGG